MHPKQILIKDFSYELPDERIAKHPLAERDQSKLLIYNNKQLSETIYREIAGAIPENSLLVFNNTKVVEARMIFQKETGANIEIFCLEPADHYPDISTALLQKAAVQWKCLVGGAKKWKDGPLQKKILLGNQEIELKVEKLEQKSDYYLLEISWNQPEICFAEILHDAGQIPLPPYLNRAVEAEDPIRYQTIYAQKDGSVAAPTAGLHFTDAVFESLEKKNIEKAFITLHVGAGTFKPVKSETIEAHEMHAEFIELQTVFIEKLIAKINQQIIPVGTTSMRTIESLYWMGLKIYKNPEISLEALSIQQWDPYDLDATGVSTELSLQALLEWMEKNRMEKLIIKTQIMIAPGYQFKIAKGIITNFHQPQSTLLLLIAAMIGPNWKTMYQYALDHDFRFLSYGDGCFLQLEEQ